MIEPPLDRLNYYNGQRLEAGDLKLEQEYHIRTRRWLNKSLYSPGIASGLEVRAQTGTAKVIVSPGLALDAEGREILLLEEESLTVAGKPRKTAQASDATVEGPYLTIRYHEESIHEERNGCLPQSESRKQNGNRPAWGGPARVRVKPQFNWRDSLPYESSGEVVLAQVELGQDCFVAQVNIGVRRYVGAASDARVRQYALEGERHIDKDNPGRIYFHIRGRQPKAVTLYLRAEKFSTLYYTELGWHEHTKSLTGNTETKPASDLDTHTHSASTSMKTEYDSPAIDESPAGTVAEVSGQHTHKHQVWGHISAVLDPDKPDFTDWIKNPFAFIEDIIKAIIGRGEYPSGKPLPNDPAGGGYAIRVITRTAQKYVSLKDQVGMDVYYGKHQHAIVGKTGDPEHKLRNEQLHRHPLSMALTIDPAGVNPNGQAQYKARSGTAVEPLTFVENLKVKIDGRPVTSDIVAQLKAASQDWNDNSKDVLGDRTSNHPIAQKGTGEIKLDFLPDVYFLEGEHVIELSVAGDGNGGRILYNLYVE